MGRCLTAAATSAGSRSGSSEERPGSTLSSCTVGTEPPKSACTTCTSTTVVRATHLCLYRAGDERGEEVKGENRRDSEGGRGVKGGIRRTKTVGRGLEEE